MNIEDVKIGTKVKLISTKVTDEYLGYNSIEMLSIGSVSQVVDFDDGYDGCDNVELSDGSWYAVDDLELLKAPEKEIAKLTVSVSVEDTNEIAKDILKIVLQDLNVVITDAIDSLELNNTESSSMQTDSHIVTEDSVLANLLNLIEKATADGDLESLLNLT
ncbi:MAG: hypothetical protein WBP57_00760, partial [Ignavibacteria bacterium]